MSLLNKLQKYKSIIVAFVLLFSFSLALIAFSAPYSRASTNKNSISASFPTNELFKQLLKA